MLRVALLCALFFPAQTILSFSQEPKAATRKVTVKVIAVYPELARKMHVTGSVKIEVVIRPEGTVKSAKLVGGSPIFVESAMTVVKQWRFEPANVETRQVVTVGFGN